METVGLRWEARKGVAGGVMPPVRQTNQTPSVSTRGAPLRGGLACGLPRPLRVRATPRASTESVRRVVLRCGAGHTAAGCDSPRRDGRWCFLVWLRRLACRLCIRASHVAGMPPTKGKGAPDEIPMPTNCHRTAHVILGPPQSPFDLLVALLDPDSQTIQPDHFGNIRFPQR
jgi:hypothetical protein